MTKTERDQVICIIGLLHSDNGYEDAMKRLYALAGKLTTSEANRIEIIIKANAAAEED